MQPITVIALIDSGTASRRALHGARGDDPVRPDARRRRSRSRRTPARSVVLRAAFRRA